jgi:hypothetical protein
VQVREAPDVRADDPACPGARARIAEQ